MARQSKSRCSRHLQPLPWLCMQSSRMHQGSEHKQLMEGGSRSALRAFRLCRGSPGSKVKML